MRRRRPDGVMIGAPTVSASTGTSPRSVSILVPRTKQARAKVSVPPFALLAASHSAQKAPTAHLIQDNCGAEAGRANTTRIPAITQCCSARVDSPIERPIFARGRLNRSWFRRVRCCGAEAAAKGNRTSMASGR
jgi:hypothetical protein